MRSGVVWVLQWLGEQINVPQLDPIGGAVLSSYIIFEWCKVSHKPHLSHRMLKQSLIRAWLAANRRYLRTSRTCLVGWPTARSTRESSTSVQESVQLPFVRPDLSADLVLLTFQFKGIESISNVVVYHHGDELLVEIDVCLPPKTPLHRVSPRSSSQSPLQLLPSVSADLRSTAPPSQAHDIGEVMQTSVEALENVSRAFTHLDYSRFNPLVLAADKMIEIVADQRLFAALDLSILRRSSSGRGGA